MSEIEILQGDCLDVLPTLPAGSVHCVVTSPPYWGLRTYGTQPRIWDGDSHCIHDWTHNRYYIEGGGGAGSSTEAFSEPGEANAERIKKARWREDDICSKCGAWRGELGLEPTPDLFVSHIVQVFAAVRSVLRDDGTVWLNLGDSYAGSWGNYHPNSPPGKHGQRLKETARWNRPAYESQEFLPPTANIKGLKPKDLCGIPWRVAFALQADGWYLRQDIIWSKPNPMPESVTDRCTKAHEYIFLLSKSERYYYNQSAILEPALQPIGVPCLTAQHKRAELQDTASSTLGTNQGNSERNKRSVWTVTTKPYRAAHFATFPPELIKPCILAGCPEGGTVLDPFLGSGTTALVAQNNGCNCIGVELNPEYVKLARKRVQQRTIPMVS